MSFVAPERLALLLVPAALLVAYLWAQRRREAYAVRFTSMELLDKVAPDAPGWRRHVPAAALLAALVALSLAAARPAATVDQPVESSTLILTLDVSLSMGAEDVEPTRLEAAKAAAYEFLEGVPDGVRVGVVGFAGRAAAFAAPTENRDAVVAAIGRLDLAEGTAIGDALLTSLDLIAGSPNPDSDGADGDRDDEGPPAATIVLLSDGESTVGSPVQEGIARARTSGIAVSTISFGTSGGTVEAGGQIVAVPVQSSTLSSVAEETGGQFFDAESSEDLLSIFDDLGSDISTEAVEREITDWFAIAGLLLGGLAAAGSIAWFSRLP